MNLDTFESHIINRYFRAFAHEKFAFNGTIYKPFKQVIISPLIFRKFTCSPNCGACCRKIALIFNEYVDFSEKTTYTINKKELVLFVDNLKALKDNWCRYLKKDGACSLHQSNLKPLVCKLDGFLKVYIHESEPVTGSTARVRNGLPGRYTRMTQINGKKGAICQIHEDKLLSKEQRNTILAGLNELQNLMNHFEIRNHIDKISHYIQRGPFKEPLILEN